MGLGLGSERAVEARQLDGDVVFVGAVVMVA